MAMFIFLLMMTSLTMMLKFSTLQAALSKNQLSKIQIRYLAEDGFNKFLYGEGNIEKYMKKDILDNFRLVTVNDYRIKLEKGHELKPYIDKLGYSFKNIDKKEMIFFESEVSNNGLKTSIKAYGPCVNELFELNKPLLDEEDLLPEEKDLFENFFHTMEKDNWDYDFPMGSNYRKINTKKDIVLNYVTENIKPILGQKQMILNSGEVNQITDYFRNEFAVIHLKRDGVENRNLTIGNTEQNTKIILHGDLYLEGDLIINQDFEFQGLIIMNGGKIIVNSKTKPQIEGMIINKGEKIDLESLNLIHNQKCIYRGGSFLPGFIDIDIQVIKKF